ncbi:S1/P1 nuclease [Roseisolibacter sp. H3M3-2]|uniref:S1/P1 nuclease n=1 Tax=Roseisolibacter sp. H3M3-2 TaxID=3031323 RepID=UPI0023DC62CA|nr:S1/P1 nuclease [Roseisolibacter sp. H3M3-2]MDF1505522.1 S1/P1 nuclease [Roseisolibacter sp. H3M3-2]
MRAATWPDVVRDRRQAERARRYHRSSWHFSDTFWRADAAGRPVRVPELKPGPEHALERIAVFSATVRDARRPAPERAVALAWLLHLVGDIHQPLHAASRVTPASPRGDRGGNDVRVGSGTLHSVWDNALDRSPGRRQGGGRRQGEDARLARADEWAAQLPRRYPAERWARWVADTLPAHWAGESLTLAQRDVYRDVADGMPLTPAYQAWVRQVSDPQATLAGYRLAVLLERLLGAP